MGILKRIVIIDIGKGPIELINPEIIKKSKKQVVIEGCLSCPNIVGIIIRPNMVTVTAYDRNKNKIEITGDGLLASAICHELDHLDGKLFVDIMEPGTLEYVNPNQPKEENK